MIERSHIESILKANGVPFTANDDDIRGLLLSARWDNTDVESALHILKRTGSDGTPQVDSIHRVFHTDGHLTPHDISTILGVDVSLSSQDISGNQNKRRMSFVPHMVVAGILALTVVIVGLGYMMYQSQNGIFHESKTFF